MLYLREIKYICNKTLYIAKIENTYWKKENNNYKHENVYIQTNIAEMKQKKKTTNLKNIQKSSF